jgi:predicted amidohydrolase
MSTLRVLIGQMTSTDRVDENFQQIKSLIERSENSPEIAFFPENSLYMRLKEGAKIEGLDLDHIVFKNLSRLAQENNLVIHLGSVPLIEGEKLSNATILIDKTGQVSVEYRKIHLFDIHLEDGNRIKESDVFHFGERPKVLESFGWKFGQSICYDVRFAELYNLYAKMGVDALLIPAAFLVQTGKAHWEVLLRARAIESQAYVIAAAQAGTHRNSQGETRLTFGNSLIVDPWGEVIARGSSDGSEKLEAVLSLDRVKSVRKQIPMASHRKL